MWLILGALIGFVAWGHYVNFAIFSIVVFYVYFKLQNRLHFFIFIFAYYLSASRGLLYGTITYYHQILFAFSIWIAAALIISFAWILFYSNKNKKLTFVIALALVSLPPFGLVGWANPLLVAGLLFPKTGLFGIAALIALTLYFVSATKYKISTLFAVVLISLILNLIPETTDNQVAVIQTNFSEPHSENRDYLKDYAINNKYLELAVSSKKDYILLPENALGTFNSLNMMIWSALPNNKTVYAGATIQLNERQTDNVLLEITNKDYKIIYKQRTPVLVSMWKPWIDKGTQAYLFKQSPVIDVDKLGRVGVLICYEQLLFYTLMETAIYKPSILFAISNLWWAKDTSIRNIQESSLDLTSRLFNIPFYYSFND